VDSIRSMRVKPPGLLGHLAAVDGSLRACHGACGPLADHHSTRCASPCSLVQVPVVEALVKDRASSSTASVRLEVHREWFKLFTSASDCQLEGSSPLLPRREPLAALSCVHASQSRVGCVNVMCPYVTRFVVATTF